MCPTLLILLLVALYSTSIESFLLTRNLNYDNGRFMNNNGLYNGFNAGGGRERHQYNINCIISSKEPLRPPLTTTNLYGSKSKIDYIKSKCSKLLYNTKLYTKEHTKAAASYHTKVRKIEPIQMMNVP